MPSRIEKNYSRTGGNKRTIKNQELYSSIDKPDYKVISSTTDFFDKQEEINEKRDVPSVLKTEKLSAFIMAEEKERDINKILKQAKNTRNREDELEKKRKLDKREYNITKKINIDDEKAVAKFREQTKNVVENEEKLSELIDTIYSKNNSDNLFDELMPSSPEETIVSDDVVEEELHQEKQTKNIIENSFFTSSLELSDDDLEEINEEDEEEIFFDDDKVPVMKIVLTIIVVITFITILGIVIYKYFL